MMLLRLPAECLPIVAVLHTEGSRVRYTAQGCASNGEDHSTAQLINRCRTYRWPNLRQRLAMWGW